MYRIEVNEVIEERTNEKEEKEEERNALVFFSRASFNSICMKFIQSYTNDRYRSGRARYLFELELLSDGKLIP